MTELVLDFSILIPACLALGAFAGFAAGLFGIGGGIILVPGLIAILDFIDFPHDYIAHIAIATALAVIIPTGFSSAFSHYKKGALQKEMFTALAPGIVLGAMLGPFLAAQLSSNELTVVFAVAIIILALIMQKPPAKNSRAKKLKTNLVLDIPAGAFIGFISAIIGIGGATLSVPYMSMKHLSIHKAIGTAAAIGVCIAIAGSASFIFNGFNLTALSSPYLLGYIFWPGWICIAISGVLAAPLGAKTSHALPRDRMRKIFAILMIVVALHLIYDLAVM